jgi:hypothetical protein
MLSAVRIMESKSETTVRKKIKTFPWHTSLGQGGAVAVTPTSAGTATACWAAATCDSNPSCGNALGGTYPCSARNSRSALSC